MIFAKKAKVLKSSQGFSAFTLSEVLIVLGIIGVVAAITLPGLLNQTNDKETVVQLQKIYSTLITATNQIVAEEGPISTWKWDEADARMEEVVEKYKNKLHFTKSCSYNISTCYYEDKWKALNDEIYFYYFTGGNAYYNIMNDGTYVVSIDDKLYVKLLQRIPGNKVQVVSKNQEYSPFTVDLETEHFKIIGKVIWSGGKKDRY